MKSQLTFWKTGVVAAQRRLSAPADSFPAVATYAERFFPPRPFCLHYLPYFLMFAAAAAAAASSILRLCPPPSSPTFSGLSVRRESRTASPRRPTRPLRLAQRGDGRAASCLLKYSLAAWCGSRQTQHTLLFEASDLISCDNGDEYFTVTECGMWVAMRKQGLAGSAINISPSLSLSLPLPLPPSLSLSPSLSGFNGCTLLGLCVCVCACSSQ